MTQVNKPDTDRKTPSATEQTDKACHEGQRDPASLQAQQSQTDKAGAPQCCETQPTGTAQHGRNADDSKKGKSAEYAKQGSAPSRSGSTPDQSKR